MRGPHVRFCERRDGAIHRAYSTRCAHETGDEDAGRCVIDFRRRANLLDRSRVQHCDPVSHGHRFDLVVRDVDRGDTELPLQLADFNAHLIAKLGVEVGQWFVEQEQRWIANDRPAHGNSLTLAT